MGAKCCDERVCVSVCLSVRSQEYLGNRITELIKFSVLVSYSGIAIRYALPILWMTLWCHIIGPIVRRKYFYVV